MAKLRFLVPLLTLLAFSCKNGVENETEQQDLLLEAAFTSTNIWYGAVGNQIGHSLFSVSLTPEENFAYFDHHGSGKPNPKNGENYAGRWRVTKEGSSTNILEAPHKVTGFIQINNDGTPESTTITDKSRIRLLAGTDVPAGDYVIHFDVLDKKGGQVLTQFQRSVELMAFPKSLTPELKRGAKIDALGEPLSVTKPVENQIAIVKLPSTTAGTVTKVLGVGVDGGEIGSVLWVLGAEIELKDSSGAVLTATTTPKKDIALASVDLAGAVLVAKSDAPGTAADSHRATLKIFDRYGQKVSLQLDFVN